jgi:hypothetical protein
MLHNRFTTLLLLTLGVLIFNSCNKNTNSSELTFKAKIGGEEFVGQTFSAMLFGNELTVTANSADNKSLVFIIGGFFGEGNYELGPNGYFQPDLESSFRYDFDVLSTNSVYISNWNESDNTLSGYFSFNLRESDTTNILIDQGIMRNVPILSDPENDNNFNITFDLENWGVSASDISVQEGGDYINVNVVVSSNGDNKTLSNFQMRSDIEQGQYSHNDPEFNSPQVFSSGVFYTATSGTLNVTTHNIEERQIIGQLLNFGMAPSNGTGGQKNLTGSFSLKY